MFEWFAANGGTLAVAAVLAAVIILIVRNMIKDKKAGKTSCSCGCSGCAMEHTCHKK